VARPGSLRCLDLAANGSGLFVALAEVILEGSGVREATAEMRELPIPAAPDSCRHEERPAGLRKNDVEPKRSHQTIATP
jgi:hypothetical protein